MFKRKIDWRDERGFTLVEMLIVLLVVSVLLLLTIPNIVSQNESINNKGCEAFVSMVQGQVQSYQLEKNAMPSVSDLVSGGYLKANQKSCPNGNSITIDRSGNVSENK
ncbi:ComG operon protein 3 precursor [Listeria ivanovii subsp. londoniensis]|uniref:ComG operon protein 3 n=1 Tax=Listeria ivanovii TaxID=1638 RepID=A0AAX2DNE6_LISIV|nr:competence type IV pilus major pilin ComGC [Listeria ivanovii]EFR97049.1 general secretion pathway protein G [Listeria ivanovii FSL F6-596]SDW52591.1 competence protein ComGC [Listeria ivanovii]VEH46278.1 ComG operon protein 3 precursor [Listeria ivanovii subsp. londoniensis]